MNWFMNILISSKITKIQSELEEKYSKKYKILKAEVKSKERQYGLISRIYELIPTAIVLGLEKNKREEELIVVLDIGSASNYLYLFGRNYQGLMNLPRIIFDINCNDEVKYIHIVDVIMEDNCIGNGSIAMTFLIDFARKFEVKYISGSFSTVDDNHAERREHFYRKFGFEIRDRKIRLDL